MKSLEALRTAFQSKTMSHGDEPLSFEGELGQAAGDVAALESELGYLVPAEISEFLNLFGGTKLFVDSFGNGLTVLPISRISSENRELQKTTGVFWPTFAVIAHDHAGDMLCICNLGGQVYFGNLHHEAWGSPELWATEAMTFAPFSEWLNCLVASSGETMPSRDIQYKPAPLS